MDEKQLLIEQMGYELLFNCILVEKDVRTSFLIQPTDYEEIMSSAKKIIAIQSIFPNLYLSDMSGETIVSNHSFYTQNDITSDEDMGKIIGYPSANELEQVKTISDKQQTIRIEINAYLENNEKIHIMSYMCLDDTYFKQMQELAKRAEHVLKTHSLTENIQIMKVIAQKKEMIPLQSLIEKLLRHEDMCFSANELIEIKNHIWNLGIENLNHDLSNPIHRGIIITLLLLCKNDPTSPFYPLQYRPEWQKVIETTKLLEKDIIDALDSTIV
jgi:hypothetical protein